MADVSGIRIKAIKEAGRADVYNMEVEETHDFAVNGGVIVHNCYDEARYAFMEMPIAPRVNEITRINLDDPLNQRATKVSKYNY